MKRKLFLGLLAAAAVLFTACQKDQTLSEVTEDDTAIGFGTYVGRDAQTKAFVAGLDELKDGFGVFAYYTADKEYDDMLAETDEINKPQLNFMVNEKVYHNSSTWTYDNT